MNTRAAFEQVVHTVHGPLVMHFYGGQIECAALELSYTREGRGRRTWAVAFDVDRSYLLPMVHARAIGLAPAEILRFTITSPVRLTWTPGPDLAAMLDTVEDAERVVGADGRANARLMPALFELEQYRFEGATQER